MATSSHLNVTDNNAVNKQKSGKITPIVKQTNKQILASNTTTPDNSATSDNTAVSNGNNRNVKVHNAKNDPKFLTQLIAANEHTKQKSRNEASPIIADANGTGNKVAFSAPSHRSGNIIHNTNKTTNATAKAGTTTGNVNNNRYASGIANVPAGKRLASHPLSAASVARNGNGLNSPVANKTSVLKAGKLALSSGTPGTKGIKRTNAGNTINGNVNSAKLTSAGKKIVDISSKASSTATASNINANDKNIPSAKKDAGVAVITKQPLVRLQQSEHLVMLPTGETYYKLDTTSLDTASIETLSGQLGLNSTRGENPLSSERNKSGMPGGSFASAPAMASAGSPNTAGNSTGTNNSGNNSAAQSATNPNILPAASASATGQSGMGIKETQTSKMSGSASTAEKLTATFNDVKFHVAGARFAAGLTAGINGTFFGPASFKGFQFGVTGNFSFGDNFSILTELKYFDRINNNYSLNDNYYTYTPAGGGQYNKTVNPLSYSFSTLHSIELPISVRYCKSKFNFYVGGNIVYTFAINTGASTLSTTTQQPTVVSAAGNNTEPSIKANDFDSKFGFGYLFGISYQISPSVMLDFRNVQTVWNNASTPGAKIISNQLYKSPSLQVSIGYRFGGNKDKGKD